MHGNVFEWCLDWYQENLGKSAVTDPVGSKSGGSRVIRGGSWGYYARHCRSANRYYGKPSYGDYGIGFRVALRP